MPEQNIQGEGGIWSQVGSFSKGLDEKSIELENTVAVSWNDFPVRCPSCLVVMQPPSSSSDMPAFNCVNCGILLKTPTNIEKAMFYGESGIERLANGVKTYLGGKVYNYFNATVPDGKKSGEQMTVIYDEKSYILTIPDGLVVGDHFRVSIDVTDAPWHKVYLAQKAKIGVGFAVPLQSTPGAQVNPATQSNTSNTQVI